MRINFNTDLADERRGIYRETNKLENEIEGIETEEEIFKNIKKTKVKILNEQGAKAIGKPIGNYITIDFKNLRIEEEEAIEEAAKSVRESLKELVDLHVKKEGEILVVRIRK